MSASTGQKQCLPFFDTNHAVVSGVHWMPSWTSCTSATGGAAVQKINCGQYLLKTRSVELAAGSTTVCVLLSTMVQAGRFGMFRLNKPAPTAEADTELPSLEAISVLLATASRICMTMFACGCGIKWGFKMRRLLVLCPGLLCCLLCSVVVLPCYASLPIESESQIPIEPQHHDVSSQDSRAMFIDEAPMVDQALNPVDDGFGPFERPFVNAWDNEVEDELAQEAYEHFNAMLENEDVESDHGVQTEHVHDFTPHDRVAIEDMLSASTFSLPTLPLPWENSWLETILGHRTSAILMPPPPMAEPWAMARVPEPAIQQHALSHVNLNLPKRATVDWAKDVERTRQLALQLWMEVMRDVEVFSVLGRQILNCPKDERNMIVVDTFAAKSTSTLRNRGYAMTQYARWASNNGVKSYPLSEDKVYSYFRWCRSVGIAATRLTKFREALAFSKFTIGLEVPSDILESRRIAGAALNMLRTKRPLRQRDPLTVVCVRFLEEQLMQSDDGFVGVLIGYFLFLLHARCRYSDGMHVAEEPTIEGDWLECKTQFYKTSKAKARREQYLPLSALACGISGFPWARTWLDMRSRLGLVARSKEPFMPVMLCSGTWTKAKLNGHDAGLMLGKFLHTLRGNANIGTHSLKATILSWLAKAGVASEPRKLLGGHVVAADESMHAYSRDSLAGPLRIMQEVMEQISSGAFDPDSSRSGRWVKKARVANEAVRDSAPSSGSDSTSSSDSESSDPGDDKVAAVLDCQGNSNSLVEQELLFQHKTYLTFHVLDESKHDVFKCGRAANTRYRMCDACPKLMVPRCRTCFGNQVADDDASD
jgi:hypothetical protein